MDIIRKSGELLEGCEEITLSSINEKGYPRTCVLSRTKSQGIKKIWCSTGLSGTKVKHFNENPKSSVCFWKDGNSVTLVGEVIVRTDRQIREEMWLDWFINHFPGGIDDPNYCILEFSTTEQATLWIDREFIILEGADLFHISQ